MGRPIPCQDSRLAGAGLPPDKNLAVARRDLAVDEGHCAGNKAGFGHPPEPFLAAEQPATMLIEVATYLACGEHHCNKNF